jgi:hypothetical protein
MYICEAWILLSIAFELKGHILVALSPDFMFFCVSDCSKVWSTYLAKVKSYLDVIASKHNYIPNLLNVVLSGLKQDTYNGCRTYDVWDGRVIMSKPIYFACDIVFKVTWLLCSSIANKCLLMKDNPRCLHIMVILYGRHNGSFSCIP